MQINKEKKNKTLTKNNNKKQITLNKILSRRNTCK